MNILRLTSAAAIAAASLAVGGAAFAGPAVNLSSGAQEVSTRSDSDAVKPVYHYRYGYYGYYPRYYYPRYYYPRSYYAPYYYSPYYYGPSFGFGFTIR